MASCRQLARAGHKFYRMWLADAGRLTTAWHLMAWRNLGAMGAEVDQALNPTVYWGMHWVLMVLSSGHTVAHFIKPKGFQFLWWSRLSAWWTAVSSLSNFLLVWFAAIHGPVSSVDAAAPWLIGFYSFAVLGGFYAFVIPNDMARLFAAALQAREKAKAVTQSAVLSSQDKRPASQSGRGLAHRASTRYLKERIGRGDQSEGQDCAHRFQGGVSITMFSAKTGSMAVMLYELFEVVLPFLKDVRDLGIPVAYAGFAVLGFIAKFGVRAGSKVGRVAWLGVVGLYFFLTTSLLFSNLFYGTYALINGVVISDEIDAGRFETSGLWTLFTLGNAFAIGVSMIRFAQKAVKRVDQSNQRWVNNPMVAKSDSRHRRVMMLQLAQIAKDSQVGNGSRGSSLAPSSSV